MSNGDTSANSMMLTGLVRSLLLSWKRFVVVIFFWDLTRLVKDPAGSSVSPEILSLFSYCRSCLVVVSTMAQKSMRPQRKLLYETVGSKKVSFTLQQSVEFSFALSGHQNWPERCMMKHHSFLTAWLGAQAVFLQYSVIAQRCSTMHAVPEQWVWDSLSFLQKHEFRVPESISRGLSKGFIS